MKLNRLIITGALCCVAVGAYAFASQAEELDVNKNLAIKELAGTTDVLGDFQIENVIKTGVNKFEKVVFSKEGVSFTPTQYDLNYEVGEEILDHKDLFRNRTSGAYITTDEEIVLVAFNRKYPYASDDATIEVCIKDVKTGKVRAEKRYLNEVKPNQYRMFQELFELNGKLYYVLTMGGESQSHFIYQVNEKELTLKLVAEKTQNNYSSRFVSDGQSLFTLISSEDGGLSLQRFDVETGETSNQSFTVEANGENISHAPDNFILNDKVLILYYNMDTGIEYFVFDREMLEQKDTFTLASNSSDGSMNYGSWTNDWKLTSDKFYCIEITNKEFGMIAQFGVYNLEDQELELEGYLPSQVVGSYTWTEKSNAE